MEEHGFTETLVCFGMALAVGLLIGAERQRGKGGGFGGVRTFPLYALAGALGAVLGNWVLVAFALCLGAFLTVAYLRESARNPADIGMSTEVAGLVSFGLGAMCTTDELPLTLANRILLVAAISTATLTLLALKEPLHGIVARISIQDVYATARLLLLAVIVLPLLPDRDVGPWDSLNPRSVGLLVVLVLGISFLGYVAIRTLGTRRGLGLTGLLGGLASSTAVTLVLSRRASEAPSAVRSIAVAVILACAVMFPRIVLEVYFVSPALAGALSWPFFAAGFVALAAAIVLYRRVNEKTLAPVDDIPVANPLTLWGAAKFGALLAAALLLSGAAEHYFSSAGLYAAATATGTVDASAIALSLGRMHDLGQVDSVVAVRAIGVGAASNTVAKILLAWFVGGRYLAERIALILIPALIVGACVLVAF